MSYCRWSSDDFNCDVYVFESVYGGWETHVACNRPVFDRSALPEADLPGPDHTRAELLAFAERYHALLDAVNNAERVPIGLPHDGAVFVDPTPGACARRLIELRETGYIVPQYAIDALLADQKELGAAGTPRPPDEGTQNRPSESSPGLHTPDDIAAILAEEAEHAEAGRDLDVIWVQSRSDDRE